MPSKQILGIPLNDQQYDDFVRISGRTAHMQLQKMMMGRDWVRMPPEVKHSVVVEVIKGARNAARGQIIRSNPEIVHEAASARQKLVRGE